MSEFKVLKGPVPAVGLNRRAIENCLNPADTNQFNTGGLPSFQAISFPDLETLQNRFPKERYPELASSGHREEAHRGDITYYSLLVPEGNSWRAADHDPR